MQPRHLWIPVFVFLVGGGAGVLWMSVRTYEGAPPVFQLRERAAKSCDPAGTALASRSEILAGEAVFQRSALTQHGTMFGDGGGRGPDFTAASAPPGRRAGRGHTVIQRRLFALRACLVFALRACPVFALRACLGLSGLDRMDERTPG